LNTDAKSAPGALVNQNGKSVAPAKKLAVGAKPKAAHTAKTTKATQRTAAVLAGDVRGAEADLQILQQR
jgi:hypothetical protein